MKVISDKIFGNYIKDKPLYSKFLVTSKFQPNIDTYTYPTDFTDKTFRLFCKPEKEYQTFKTKPYTLGHLPTVAPSINDMINEVLPPFWDPETKTLDFTLPIEAECQMCKIKMFFLLNITSDGPFDKSKKQYPNIYIQKVGQIPAFEIRPENETLNYLIEEDKANYSKALANLSISYGIGAFAYFRRIIENEIKRLIHDIINFSSTDSQKLRAAYEDYNSNHQMSTLISALNTYLPNAFKDIGDNPIKLLHDQLSGGIHEYSDETCMEKAINIDIILRFTIKKIKEEKQEIQDIRKAIITLKNK